RTLLPVTEGGSAVKESSTSPSPAIARVAPASARRNASRGLSSATRLSSRLPDDAFGQVRADEARLIAGDDRPLRLVALVEEGEAEGEADVAENGRVLRPGDDGARAHHGRDVAAHEAAAGEVGDLDHLRHLLAAALVVIFAGLGEDDSRLEIGRASGRE